MNIRGNFVLVLVYISVVVGIIYLCTGQNNVNTINRAKNFIQTLTNRENQERVPLPTPLIIITYMRSGSTFLSDVIQASTEVFFVFEPLWILMYQKLVTFSNQTIAGSLYVRRRHIIDAIFSCNTMQLPRKILYLRAFNNVGHYTANFTSCIKKETELQCLNYLRNQCLKSRFILIKTIRMRMHELMEYKKSYPHLKMIYLLRDPRAVLLSQLRFQKFVNTTSRKYSRKHCMHVSFDSAVANTFSRIYPGDIYIVIYERFSTDPVSHSENLYNKFNISFTDITERNIRELTVPKTNCSRTFSLCTSKINTTANTYRWRESISYGMAKTIENECEEVFKEYGFIPISSEAFLRNYSFKTFNISETTLKNV